MVYMRCIATTPCRSVPEIPRAGVAGHPSSDVVRIDTRRRKPINSVYIWPEKVLKLLIDSWSKVTPVFQEDSMGENCQIQEIPTWGLRLMITKKNQPRREN